MKIKHIILFFLLTFVLSLSSDITLAQKYRNNYSTSEEFATDKAGKMSSRLSLTDAQYKEVYNLFLNHYSLRNEIKNRNLSTEERNNLRNQCRQEMDKQLEGILTPDQMSKYKENKTLKKNHSRNKKMNGNY